MVKPSLFDPREARKALVEATVSPAPDLKTGVVAKSSTHLSGVANVDPLKQDFRKFLYLVWKFLDLPAPTPIQYDMARWLQIGPDRAVIMGFRGVAKSWITAAYALWTLYCDPQKKVLVVSGSAVRSVAFTNFCLTLIRTMPLLKHLEPRADQRQSSTAFDVAGALPDQTPSFSARGITGQLVGLRSDLIIPDDVETNTNAATPDMREKLGNAIKEFDAILKPGGRVKFLGTPQSDASIYAILPKRGYTLRVWPARYPDDKQRAQYGVKLASMIARAIEADPSLVGRSTEPSRFTDEDLAQRELSWGSLGFSLQYMLDTSLADLERYPLKLKNLIVMSLDHERGPDLVTWGNDPDKEAKELPSLGLDNDGYYRPATTAEATSKWSDTIMEIDPSGKGSDETAYAVMSQLHARVFLRAVGGFLDGYGVDTLKELARLCVHYKVRKVRIESNFGDGMFGALLAPYLKSAWAVYNKDKPQDLHLQTEIEEVQAKRQQKELRVISILDPLLKQHRLVVNATAIEEDYKSIQKAEYQGDLKERYSAFYQLTRLTYEKDCLAHDDRVEVIAGACNEWVDILGIAPESLARDAEEERMDETLKELMEEEDEVLGIKGAGNGTGGNFGSRHGLGAGRRA